MVGWQCWKDFAERVGALRVGDMRQRAGRNWSRVLQHCRRLPGAEAARLPSKSVRPQGSHLTSNLQRPEDSSPHGAVVKAA